MAKPDEAVLWKGRPDWKAPVVPLFALLVLVGVAAVAFGLSMAVLGPLCGVLLAIAVLAAGISYAQTIGYSYTLTATRAQSEYKFFSRETKEVELEHLRDVCLSQSVLQRLIGVGTLELSTAGGDGVEVIFRAVKDPEGVRKLIRSSTAPVD